MNTTNNFVEGIAHGDFYVGKTQPTHDLRNFDGYAMKHRATLGGLNTGMDYHYREVE